MYSRRIGFWLGIVLIVVGGFFLLRGEDAIPRQIQLKLHLPQVSKMNGYLGDPGVRSNLIVGRLTNPGTRESDLALDKVMPRKEASILANRVDERGEHRSDWVQRQVTFNRWMCFFVALGTVIALLCLYLELVAIQTTHREEIDRVDKTIKGSLPFVSQQEAEKSAPSTTENRLVLMSEPGIVSQKPELNEKSITVKGNESTHSGSGDLSVDNRFAGCAGCKNHSQHVHVRHVVYLHYFQR